MLGELVPHAVSNFGFGLAYEVGDSRKGLEIWNSFEVPSNDLFRHLRPPPSIGRDVNLAMHRRQWMEEHDGKKRI